MARPRQNDIKDMVIRYLQCGNYAIVAKELGMNRKYVHTVVDEYMSEIIRSDWRKILWREGATSVERELIHKWARQEKRGIHEQNRG